MDKIFMKKAIDLAIKGTGFASPNPLVGALIVKNDQIIGQGYHECFGKNHAEINAIQNSKDDILNSTMYVTLEPCSHFGKTPPCAEAIAKSGIKKVVIGLKDPNPLVSGSGIKTLKNAGIEVVTGVLEDKCKKLNEVFIKYIEEKTPFVTLKYAMTLDGKISTYTGDSRWISNAKSREYVHELRHKNSAIMVGIGTVLNDDPSLNTRLDIDKPLDPIRIIVDTSGRIPLDSKVLNLESRARTILATTKLIDKDKLTELKNKNISVIICPLLENQVDLNFLLESLKKDHIDSILLEGGSELNFNMLKESLVDKVITFIAPKIIGGKDSKTPVGGLGIELMKNSINTHKVSYKVFDDDICIESYVKKEWYILFTGLVEEVGTISSVKKGNISSQITIRSKKVIEDIKIGDSIATNGICLTVTEFTDSTFTVDVMSETLRVSSLESLSNGDKVNLERALRLGDRLGGHMVSGHIDGTGNIESFKAEDNATIVTISASSDLLRYVIYKGSIAIDGVSLTVFYVDESVFKVSIIPHTSMVTTLLDKSIEYRVNLECDMIGKYVEKLLVPVTTKDRAKDNISMSFLTDNGFI